MPWQVGREGMEEKVIEQVREMKGLGMGRVIHKKLTSLRTETAGASDSKPEAIIFKDGWG